MKSKLRNLLIKLQEKYIKFILQTSAVKKDCICFQSSPDFSDNCYVLFQYLRKEYKNYKFYWLVSQPSQFREYEAADVAFIKKNICGSSLVPLKTIRILLSSKYSFFTHQSILQEYHNPAQLQINLWHGCGYKDIHNKSCQVFFDYVLVPGPLFIETKANFFSCEKAKVLPIGYPRYDELLDKKKVSALRKKILCDSFKKIIMWMPTFRKTKQNYSENLIQSDYFLPICSCDADLDRINAECAKFNILLLIKKHRNQIDNYVDMKHTNIRFLSDGNLSENKIGLYTLIGTADALITDYSSVAIDYLLLDRPIGFTLDDYEQYKMLRGFVFDNVLDYMPGSHIYSLEQFILFLSDVAAGKDNYQNARNKMIGQMHSKPIETSYCKRIVDFFKL